MSVTVSRFILFPTVEEYDAVRNILSQPIVIEGPKRGMLRRPEKETVVLVDYVGHSNGRDEHAERRAMWLADWNGRGLEMWDRIQEALSHLKVLYSEDPAEAEEFLGRSASAG